MRYDARIPQSPTDTEYDGGEKWKYLISLSDLNPTTTLHFPDPNEKRFIFRIDTYAYTERGNTWNDTRGFIVTNSPDPRRATKTRVFGVVGGTEQKMNLVEFVPKDPLDKEIFDLAVEWFLSPSALGHGYYKSILSASSGFPYYESDHQTFCTLFDKPIPEEWEIIDGVIERVKWTYTQLEYAYEMAKSGSNTYGCKNRSEEYRDKLLKPYVRWKGYTATQKTWCFHEPNSKWLNDIQTNPKVYAALPIYIYRRMRAYIMSPSLNRLYRKRVDYYVEKLCMYCSPDTAKKLQELYSTLACTPKDMAKWCNAFVAANSYHYEPMHLLEL